MHRSEHQHRMREGARALGGRLMSTFRRLRATDYQLRGPLLLLLVLLLLMLALGRATGRIGWAIAAWAVLVLIVLVPRLQVRGELKDKERLEAENGARQTLVQLAGGVLLFAGAWVAWAQLQEQHNANTTTASVAEQNLRLAQDNLLLTKQAQATERFTRALDQLNSDRLQVRLGAIYSLGRISRDSPSDQWAIMEILATFVREKSSWGPQAARSTTRHYQMPDFYVLPKEQRIRQDVQAALTVLGSHEWHSDFAESNSGALHGYWRTWMDLSESDLRGADLMEFRGALGKTLDRRQANVRVNLQKSHLEGAQLHGAHLESASLISANLEGAAMESVGLAGASLLGATLDGARLDFASLDHADLDDVSARKTSFSDVTARGATVSGDFTDAALDGANLRDANLRGGRFIGADLSGAVLSGANVRDADFTRAKFDKADLRGVNFQRPSGPGGRPPRGLTIEQLRSAITDHTTLLPDYLKAAPPGSPAPVPTPSASPSRP